MGAPGAWEIRSDTTKNSALGAGLGLGSLILGEDTLLTVDPHNRMLRFQRKGRWSLERAEIEDLAERLWFRLEIGPWCPAMWFGTAPPVILVAAFTLLLALFRRFW